MNPVAQKLYDIKEKIQDLQDQRTLLIVETLKEYGWLYTNKTPTKSWLWHKQITMEGVLKDVFMSRDDAWSTELVLTLSNAYIGEHFV